jgi:hypothetical protein
MVGLEKHHFGVVKTVKSMLKPKTIQLTRRANINDTLWNNCITLSGANLGYAHCEYLDAMCEHGWVGLVYGNYEAVFPLPIKKLWGLFNYVVQPKFCQQLGVFGNLKECSEEDFLSAIPWYFFRVRLHLNSYNQAPLISGITYKTNFILELQYPIKINKDGQKNIRLVSHFNYAVNAIDAEPVIELYKQRWGALNPQIRELDYHRLLNATKRLGYVNDFSMKEIGFIVISAHPSTTNKDETNLHELIGAGLFLVTTQGPCRFAHFILGAPNPSHLESNGIMHGIINAALNHFQRKIDVFDFEGSSIPSVAEFYKKFNPIDKPFRILKKGL